MDCVKLTLTDMKKIYETEAARDFPPDELKPFSAIERLFRMERYFGYGFYGEGALIAYAFFVRLPEVPSILLDYYAVMPKRRSGGCGSQILAKIGEELSKASGLIIEVENPDAGSKDQEEERMRRIRFYEKNGARMTNIGLRVYTAHYRIMYLPFSKDADDRQIREDLSRIYASIFPEKLYEKNVEFTSLHTL